MKGTLKVCSGLSRYEFVYVKVDSYRGNMGQGRDEVDECVA